MRPPFLNIRESIAGYRWNRSPLFVELTFSRKSSVNSSIDNRYCNQFIHIGRPIFPMNHNGASLCSLSQSHLGSCMRVTCLHWRGTGHLICDRSRIMATRQLHVLTSRIMAGLQGCYSSSTRGSRANDAVKTRAYHKFVLDPNKMNKNVGTIQVPVQCRAKYQ